VDGLQEKALFSEERNEETALKLKDNIVEAHGRLGLYKCLPEEDSDTDSSSDEDDDRPVHLGHRRKYRAWKRRHAIARKKPSKSPPESMVSTDVSSSVSTVPTCEYQMLKSLRVDQLGPPAARATLKPKRANPRAAAECDNSNTGGPRRLKSPPCCPSCGNLVLPQTLLFDEGYHSHDHYNFIKMEDWLAAAEVLVFVGTSFSVTLPQVALDHAREVGLPVFNFNVSDMLGATARLNVENITGPSQETLPKLYQAIQHLEEEEAMCE
jgi:NAD-dependent SIR2 family protein deacetylase